MNRASLEEMFDHDGWAWDEIGSSLQELSTDTLARPAPGSGWPALRNCFGHMAFGYNAWLSRLDGGARPELDLDRADWAAIDAFYKSARARFRTYFDSITDEHLLSDRDVVDSDGTVLRYTPAEVLAHVLAHSRAHHGDLYTLYHQLGLDLNWPLIDYRYYLDARR